MKNLDSHLQNVILRNGQKVVHGRDIVHGVGQDLNLVDPGVSEDFQVLLRDFALGPRK